MTTIVLAPRFPTTALTISTADGRTSSSVITWALLHCAILYKKICFSNLKRKIAAGVSFVHVFAGKKNSIGIVTVLLRLIF
jgi:hypothetical protein